MSFYLMALLAGVVLAWLGGTLFVTGGVSLAKIAKWPPAVIGVTVAAFGTSSPELMVSVQSALAGVPQIALGDVLGSNVVNVSLILAVVLAMSGLKADDGGIRRDWACALAVPAGIAAVLWDGWFSRMDAAVLTSCFAIWLMAVVMHARRHALQHLDEIAEVQALPKLSVKLTVAQVLGGLLLLMVAAQFVVYGGRGMAALLGWSPFIVGAVVVAVATGTPELATTIVARAKGHHDVGLGAILGSNVFNALIIASVAAFIRPYGVRREEILPSIAFGIVTVLLVCPGKGGALGRWRGAVLLGVYALYIALTLRSGGH